MDTTKIKGLIAAPFSPLDEKGELNLEIIPEYFAFLKKNGVIGVFINGTSGEGFSLTTKERMQVLKKWMEARESSERNSGNEKTFKIIVHIGSTSILDEKALAEHAEELNVDGISSMAPLFLKPSNLEDLYAHIKKVAKFAPKTPYYYYNIPQISGVKFPMIDLLKKVENTIPNFAGIKYSFPDFEDYNLCMGEFGEKYDLPFCSDQVLISAMAMGAKGSIGSTYNFAAPLSNKIIQLFNEGKHREAQLMEYKLIQLVRILANTGCYFSAAKHLMRGLNINLGTVRSPLRDIDVKRTEEIENNINQLGVKTYFSKPF